MCGDACSELSTTGRIRHSILALFCNLKRHRKVGGRKGGGGGGDDEVFCRAEQLSRGGKKGNSAPYQTLCIL